MILIDGHSYHPSSKEAEAVPHTYGLHVLAHESRTGSTQGGARQRGVWFLVELNSKRALHFFRAHVQYL